MQSLIVLGASARAAAFSARRAGFQPYAIDLFADRDLAAICPAEKIRRYPYDFLVSLAAAPRAPWIYTGGLENFPRLVDLLATLRPLLGNPGSVLRQVRDPLRLARATSDAGCSFPPLGGTAGMRRSAAPRWLLKARRSSGGLGIRFASQDEIARPPQGLYLQQYIEGESASAVFAATSGKSTLLGVTRQLLGSDVGHNRPFLYVGSVGPIVLRDAELAKLFRLGNLVTERFGLAGLFNIDFVRTNDEIWPVEVNPRYSASIEVLERVSNTNFIELHVEACKNKVLDAALPTSGRFAGKATVYARQSGLVPPALDDVITAWNLPGQLPGLADIPRVGEPLSAGQPVVTVLYSGASLVQVEAELRRRVGVVESLLA